MNIFSNNFKWRMTILKQKQTEAETNENITEQKLKAKTRSTINIKTVAERKNTKQMETEAKQ